MIKAVIVDDESHIRELVARMVSTCCPNVIIVAKAEGVKSAVEAINKHDPDLVISDIQMTDGIGFDIVRHFETPGFRIIFMSASSEYAKKSREFNAVAFLTKPIFEKELKKAVDKAVISILEDQ